MSFLSGHLKVVTMDINTKIAFSRALHVTSFLYPASFPKVEQEKMCVFQMLGQVCGRLPNC